MTDTQRVTRRLAWRWLGWFALANTAVLGLVSLRYFSALPGVEGLLALIYGLASYIGFHAVLATLPLLLLCLPLLLLWPRRGPLTFLAVVWMAGLVALLVLDSLLWSQGRFHLNLLTAQVLGWQSWLFVAVMFVIGLAFESMLARAVWRKVAAGPGRLGMWPVVLLTLCFLTAQCIYAWADASYYTPVTRLAQQLPVHRGFTAKKFLLRSGLVDIERAREAQLSARLTREMESAGGTAAGRGLNYPLAPLACRNEERLNLLILMLDAWRFDMLNETVTPRLAAWADERASRFESHYSGGNSSRMGVFSFFYGLPPGYFPAFEAAQRPALLISEAQRQNYALGLYTSADMYRPVALDRTAFASVPGLRVTPANPGAPAWQRDRDLLSEWLGFLDGLTSTQPFLGFLFFDAPNIMQLPPDYVRPVPADPAHPMAERFADYQAAIHHTDALVGEVLDDLERRGLAERTVVLVTADHGEEFQESGSEFVIHGSGYSRYQLQVPMLLAWPGRGPERISRRSSHNDVAPTLLGRLFGCANPAAEYSSGSDLFEGKAWDWLLAGSYFNYAVLQPERVTITWPNGLFEVRDADYRVQDAPGIDTEVLEAVMRENRRFYP